MPTKKFSSSLRFPRARRGIQLPGENKKNKEFSAHCWEFYPQIHFIAFLYCTLNVQNMLSIWRQDLRNTSHVVIVLVNHLSPEFSCGSLYCIDVECLRYSTKRYYKKMFRTLYCFYVVFVHHSCEVAFIPILQIDWTTQDCESKNLPFRHRCADSKSVMQGCGAAL